MNQSHEAFFIVSARNRGVGVLVHSVPYAQLARLGLLRVSRYRMIKND